MSGSGVTYLYHWQDVCKTFPSSSITFALTQLIYITVQYALQSNSTMEK
jgi:hypothetical protein